MELNKILIISPINMYEFEPDVYYPLFSQELGALLYMVVYGNAFRMMINISSH